jgi:hypothetical protein
MSNRNSPITIVKSIRSTILKIRHKLEYRLHTNCSYALHRLQGGSTRTRLLKYSAFNWQTRLPPTRSRLDRHAIFVAYHPGQVAPESNVSYLQSLVNCGFQITYIHNGPLEAALREPIEQFCTQIICRENIGQDFGAWKDWLLDGFQHHRFQEVEWLLLCNDSNFFLANHAQAFESKFTAALSDDAVDLIALNKNLEYTPHYQSYFTCYHRRIFFRPDFVKFWNQYRPLSNRYHAINKGEIQLTTQITRLARSKILYNWSDLYVELSRDAPKRSEFYSQLPKGCMYLSQHSPEHGLTDTAISKLELQRAFMILELHNPSHALALFFVKYCNSPFLKKDIVKHGCYSIAQITELLISINVKKDSRAWNEILNLLMLANNSSFINNPQQAHEQAIPIHGQRFRGHGPLLSDLGLAPDA